MPDMKTAKALREEREPLVGEIKRLAELVNTEARDFNAEEKTKWEKVNADYNNLSRQIDIAERFETVAGQQSRNVDYDLGRGNLDGRNRQEDDREESGAPSDEERSLAIQGWCVYQSDLEPNEAQVRAAKRCGVSLRSKELHLNLSGTTQYRAMQREARAQSFGSFTGGGATVPSTLLTSLERAQLVFGGVRQVADVMRTSTGEEMHWPTSNDTSNTGELIGENPTTANEQDVTFGRVTFNAYTYSSKLVRISNQLLQDSAIDMASTLGSMLGERIGRKQNADFTTGDGASKPYGIVTAATLGVTAASATAIASDEIISLIHSVDPAYRMDAGFMLHDSVLLAIRKLKTGDGQYIWQPGMGSGAPDRLYGFSYTVNQQMASSVATGNKTILFGALKKYKVRDVQDITLKRLVERYAELNQEGFVAFARADGNLLDAGVAPVKYLQQF